MAHAFNPSLVYIVLNQPMWVTASEGEREGEKGRRGENHSNSTAQTYTILKFPPPNNLVFCFWIQPHSGFQGTARFFARSSMNSLRVSPLSETSWAGPLLFAFLSYSCLPNSHQNGRWALPTALQGFFSHSSKVIHIFHINLLHKPRTTRTGSSQWHPWILR